MPMQSNALGLADAVTYNANRFASLDHYMRVQAV